MVAMRFDYRDIFRSARLAFSFQRLWIQFLGLGLGYFVYVVLTYLSFILSGKSFDAVWSRFGLLPCALGSYLPWYSWVIFALGALILLFAWLVTSTAVARASYMNLKGNNFYTWKEACAFAFKKKGGSVIATPIAILAIAFFTGLGGVIVGLLGKIPYVGWIGVSLFSVIWYLASLFLVFVSLALGVSLFITPSVLATTDDDAFEGIFQSFSILYSQPWRFIFYELQLGVIAVFGFGVFALFAKKAWTVMTTILMWGMGERYADLSYYATYLLQTWIYQAFAWSKALMGDYASYFLFTHEVSAIDLSPAMGVAAWILGIFMVIIGGFILSYPLAIFNAGNSIIFLILKKKKDEENLLERKDREEEDDEDEVLEETSEKVESKEKKKEKDEGKKKKATKTKRPASKK